MVMHADARNAFRELCLIRSTLIDILKTVYPKNTCNVVLKKKATEYVRCEFENIIRYNSKYNKVFTLYGKLKALSEKDLAKIRLHCLFYSSGELVNYIAGKRIGKNTLFYEEAVLYAQEKLYANNFRRIRYYDKNKGASYKTYIWNVIKNLLTDFLIKKNKETEREISYEDIDYVAFSEKADLFLGSDEGVCIDKARLLSMVKNITLGKQYSVEYQPSENILEKVSTGIGLTEKDRVFLNALCEHELNINKVRKFPDLNMGQSEAYRLYHDIIKRLRHGYKSAGVYDDVKSVLEVS